MSEQPNKVTEQEIDQLVLDINTIGIALSRAEELVLQIKEFEAQQHYYHQLLSIKTYYIFLANHLREQLEKYMQQLKDENINVIPLKYQKMLKQLANPSFQLPQ